QKQFCVFVTFTKYKEAGKREVSSSLYSKLPETLDTLRAKEVSQLQSQVLSAGFYKEQYNREKGKSSYTNMKTLPEVEHAMEVNKNQSEIGYRKGKEELHHYNTVPDRPDIINAANAAKLASDVSVLPSMHWVYHRANGHVQVVDLSRPLPQVKYKESFDRHLKGQRPRYNPLDCLSFKHKQAAAALASQVEYKKKYEQTKAHYHVALDTAEQLHHKENAVLHSQVKYREEYEKNKGRSQMEFGDTQTYRVSKEAQKMQSEREYRRDYEEQMKGKALVDVDQTPGYLTARHASSLLSEVTHTHTHTCSDIYVAFKTVVVLYKEYRKDLEQEVKGRGLSGLGLEDTPELLRVKNANQILNQVKLTHHSHTCKSHRDMERDVVGKGMELSADVLEIQRAKRASEIQSQVPVCLIKSN
uniref:Nebulette n=1 Tax=Seriola dumerili TaxID=41447 RepID=A0A3B4VQD2_SERDU